MKNKKVIGIIVAIVFVILVIIGIYFFRSLSYDKSQEEILRSEVNELSKKDLTVDSFDTSIKTTGDYAIVERTIKSYLNEYATNVQAILKIIEDKEFKNLLTADNYQNDGPEFKNTLNYIDTTKSSLTGYLDTLNKMSDEDYIMKRIEDKKLDKYYNNLYKELMFDGINKINLKSAKDDLTSSSDKIIGLLDKEKEIINLLIENKGKWSIQSGKIVFNDTNTLNSYNSLVSDLNK